MYVTCDWLFYYVGNINVQHSFSIYRMIGHADVTSFSIRFIARLLAMGLLLCSTELMSAQEVDSVVPETHFPNTDFETKALNMEFHAKKREDLRSIMPENSVAIVFSNSIKNRSNDVVF